MYLELKNFIVEKHHDAGGIGLTYAFSRLRQHIPLALNPEAHCVFVCPLCSSVGRVHMRTFSSSQEDAFHKPVKLAKVTKHLDSDCEPELRQTLLSNGHTLRPSQNESAPLRRASD